MGLLEVYTPNQLTSLAVSSSGDLIEVDSDNESPKSEEKQPKTECSNCLECHDIRIDFTSIIIDRLELLITSAPYHTLQWLASVCYANKPIQEWLLDNMSFWVKQLLINHKQTNIRFSAAILLANLIPNRQFRETFTSNRNMLIPFKNQATNSLLNLTSNSTSNSSVLSNSNNQTTTELNYDFESEECKKVLHRIIKYLFSLVEDLGQYVGAKTSDQKTKDKSATNNEANKLPTTSNRLVQYFTFLIYCMCTIIPHS